MGPSLAGQPFAAVPFIGPVRYFTAEKEGWRCVEGILVILTGALWFLGMIAIPEACALVLPAKMSIAAASVNR